MTAISADDGKPRWQMIGVVSGGVDGLCGDRDHPTRIVRLQNAEIMDFIQANTDYKYSNTSMSDIYFFRAL